MDQVVQEFLSIFERTGISNNFCKQNGSIIIIDKNRISRLSFHAK